MVISPLYRYVFVEIPQTASTAISDELCQFYGGRRVLWKHSSYQDFLKVATEEERQYRVLACARHPMDIAVSSYFKALTDHRKEYSWSFGEAARQEGWLSWFLMRRYREYRFIRNRSADFRAYFRRFYWWVYNSRVCMLPEDTCLLIRFERLQEDFENALKQLRIRKVRDIPVHNVTATREPDFASYYPPDLRRRAIFVLGPFIEAWGHSFPADWGIVAVPWVSRVLFRLDSFVRTLYFQHVHFRLLGRAVRRNW